MTYHDFVQDIRVTISRQYEPQCSIEVRTIQKNNGMTLDGLIIRNPSVNIAPTIYLNPYYHRYLDGQPLSDIYQDIIDTYESAALDSDFDMKFFRDFNQVKKTLVMKLINFDRNAQLLVDVPHLRFHDLAVVFQSMVTCGIGENGTILIQDSHLKLWDITLEELHRAALANAPLLLAPKIYDIREVLDLPLSEMTEEMYVLTNSSSLNGASVILYEGVLDELAKKLGQDMILLPCSIHEFIAVPVKKADYEMMVYFGQMVRDINTMELADDEILSDNVYFYSREAGAVATLIEHPLQMG